MSGYWDACGVWQQVSCKRERDSSHILFLVYAANNPMAAAIAANPGSPFS